MSRSVVPHNQPPSELSREALDALPQQVAVLDADGTIAFVNEAWVRFAQANDHPAPAAEHFIGSDYLAALSRVPEGDPGAPIAEAALRGIREVVAGERARFSLEYPCHSPTTERWFILDATPRREGRGAVAVHTDISRRKRAELELHDLNASLEQRVRERSEEVRRLAASLTLAEQQERARISRVLHDSVQQTLYALLWRYGPGTAHSAPESEDPGEVRELLHQAIRATRALSAELNPPVLREQGLQPALLWLAAHMRELYGLEVTSEFALTRPEALPEEAAVFLFQTARELLFNVVKHASVRRARLGLTAHEGALDLRVDDAGAGFAPDAPESGTAGGSGLANLRRRAQLLGGTVALRSSPGAGTRVRVTLPLAPVR